MWGANRPGGASGEGPSSGRQGSLKEAERDKSGGRGTLCPPWSFPLPLALAPLTSCPARGPPRVQGQGAPPTWSSTGPREVGPAAWLVWSPLQRVPDGPGKLAGVQPRSWPGKPDCQGVQAKSIHPANINRYPGPTRLQAGLGAGGSGGRMWIPPCPAALAETSHRLVAVPA